jgi:hypothetical protein
VNIQIPREHYEFEHSFPTPDTARTSAAKRNLL